MSEMIENGWHELSGVGRVWYHDDWNDEDVEGVAIRIDGVVYTAYVDPSDGFRSYGYITRAIQGEKLSAVFLPQPVFVQNSEERSQDDNGWPRDYSMLSVYNHRDELILCIGTDHSDSYYPRAIFQYNPENLPINF